MMSRFADFSDWLEHFRESLRKHTDQLLGRRPKIKKIFDNMKQEIKEEK